MPSRRNLLVVDSNDDNGALLVRSLSRKFPLAAIELRPDAGGAIEVLATRSIDAIVLHRTDTDDAAHLIEAFKRIAPTVPIIAVSGVDRSKPLMEAGASAFLLYDEWLRIGAVVQAVLNESAAAPKPLPEIEPTS